MPEDSKVIQHSTVSAASLHALSPRFSSESDLLCPNNFFSQQKFLKIWFKSIGASYLLQENLTEVPADKVDLDNSLQLHLLNITHSNFKSLVEDAESTLKGWKALEERCMVSNMGTRITAKEEWLATRHDPSQPVDVYIKAIQNGADLLKGLKC